MPPTSGPHPPAQTCSVSTTKAACVRDRRAAERLPCCVSIVVHASNRWPCRTAVANTLPGATADAVEGFPPAFQRVILCHTRRSLGRTRRKPRRGMAGNHRGPSCAWGLSPGGFTSSDDGVRNVWGLAPGPVRGKHIGAWLLAMTPRRRVHVGCTGPRAGRPARSTRRNRGHELGTRTVAWEPPIARRLDVPRRSPPNHERPKPPCISRPLSP